LKFLVLDTYFGEKFIAFPVDSLPELGGQLPQGVLDKSLFNTAVYGEIDQVWAYPDIEWIPKLLSWLEDSRLTDKYRQEVQALIDHIRYEHADQEVSQKPTKRQEFQAKREKLFMVLVARDGEQCAVCKATTDLAIDHVVPLSRGGDNELRNLRLLCRRHNSSKGNKLDSEWKVSVRTDTTEMMGGKMICDVCGEREAVGVACSAMGAVSIAYCAECLRVGREPYALVIGGLMGSSSMEDVADWLRPIVEATLEAEGKTQEQLFADIAALEQEYRHLHETRGGW